MFYIDVPVAEAGCMCHAFDIQRAFGRLAAMSGAVDAYDKDGFLTPPGTDMRTLVWVREQLGMHRDGVQFEDFDRL